MKREHVNFSLGLELLSLLPCGPDRALVADVVSDLGLNEADDLLPLLKQLHRDGYQVELKHAHVWIPEAEWMVCREAATHYLQIVYGGDEQAATC